MKIDFGEKVFIQCCKIIIIFWAKFLYKLTKDTGKVGRKIHCTRFSFEVLKSKIKNWKHNELCL